MQNHHISRWLTALMAFCVSFIIIVSCAAALGIESTRQIDFWLLWLTSMLVLALPLAYLEVALVKRTKTSALQALSSLTRDADASTKWRLVGWAAVIFMPFVAGYVMLTQSVRLQTEGVLSLTPQLIYLGMAVIALALSILKRQWLILVSALSVLVSLAIGWTTTSETVTWQWTSVEFSEWGQVTVLALVASGLGLGIYSQTALADVQAESVATKTSLPIWVFQLLAVVAFGTVVIAGQLSSITLAVASIAIAALLIQLAREQLQQRQIASVLQWGIPVAVLALWCVAVLNPVFTQLLMVWGLLICLIYAIFAGWIMKISHLRKALNFSGEVTYNLWRIATRIVLPVGIILALVSLVIQWL